MRIIFTIQLLFFASQTAYAQENFWHVLAEVRFETKSDDTGQYEIEIPVFSNHVKSYDNKTVRLKGYIIPLTELGGSSNFMFSSVPFSMCFFCGNAGPETVVEIETKANIQFTSRQVMIEGILVLNGSDPEHHMYILKSAKLIK